MSERSTDRAGERLKLLDENEQLRTALESSLEENARLIGDLERLERRVTYLSGELGAARAALLNRAGSAGGVGL